IGAEVGVVTAYNYAIDCTFASNTTWNNFCFFASHDSGGGMSLYEGNQTNGLVLDDAHGNSPQVTLFRNHFRGLDESTTYPKSQNGIPLTLEGFGRAVDVVGNVLGLSGYHTQYEYSSGPGGTMSDKDHSI